MALSEKKQQLSGKIQTGSNFSRENSRFAPPNNGYKRTDGIPRNQFSYLFQQGPHSMPWSRNRKRSELKEMGDKILKERFPGHYGSNISGSEIDREIQKLKRTSPQNQEQKNAFHEEIARLEDLKKRTGL